MQLQQPRDKSWRSPLLLSGNAFNSLALPRAQSATLMMVQKTLPASLCSLPCLRPASWLSSFGGLLIFFFFLFLPLPVALCGLSVFFSCYVPQPLVLVLSFVIFLFLSCCLFVRFLLYAPFNIVCSLSTLYIKKSSTRTLR